MRDALSTVGWVGTGSSLVQGELVRFVRTVGEIPTGTVGCLVGFNTFASCFVRVMEPHREIYEVPVAVLEPAHAPVRSRVAP
jgi:hypothetical protein